MIKNRKLIRFTNIYHSREKPGFPHCDPYSWHNSGDVANTVMSLTFRALVYAGSECPNRGPGATAPRPLGPGHIQYTTGIKNNKYVLNWIMPILTQPQGRVLENNVSVHSDI